MKEGHAEGNTLLLPIFSHQLTGKVGQLAVSPLVQFDVLLQLLWHQHLNGLL